MNVPPDAAEVDLKKMLVLDIKKAFLLGEVERDIFIELPKEDAMSKTGKYVGKLFKTMYGTRDAPRGFQDFLGRVLGRIGFKACRTSPCIYYSMEFDMKIVAHVDDLLINGRRKDLGWVKLELEKEIEVTREFLGNRASDKQEVRFLGRFIRVTKDGYEIEGDVKVLRKLLEEWYMDEAKGVATSGVKAEARGDEEDEQMQLSEKDHRRFRRAAAQCNYLGLDRADVAYAAKEKSRGGFPPRPAMMWLLRNV